MKRAFDAIEENEKYAPLYEAGLARERADWLVGINLTRAYTNNARRQGYNAIFRVGRVTYPYPCPCRPQRGRNKQFSQ